MMHMAMIQTGQATSRPQAEVVRPVTTNHTQATNNVLTLQIHVIYETPLSKLWYPRIVESILQDSGSYIVPAPDGFIYRQARFHLKPYKPIKSCSQQVSTQTTSVPAKQG